MNRAILKAFESEMGKIANAKPPPSVMAYRLRKESGVLSNVGNKIYHTLKSGWQYGSNIPGGGWLGTGHAPATGKITAGHVLGRVTSLGGLTRYLPVGPKALTAGFTAMALPGTMKKEDPSKKGRSRAERIGELAGGTIAGLAATPKGLWAIPAGVAGSVVGGGLGRLIGPRKPKPVETPGTAEVQK